MSVVPNQRVGAIAAGALQTKIQHNKTKNNQNDEQNAQKYRNRGQSPKIPGDNNYVDYRKYIIGPHYKLFRIIRLLEAISSLYWCAIFIKWLYLVIIEIQFNVFCL